MKKLTVSLENWREKPDDFMIIRDIIETPDGEREAYLITNQVSQAWHKIDEVDVLENLIDFRQVDIEGYWVAFVVGKPDDLLIDDRLH